MEQTDIDNSETNSTDHYAKIETTPDLDWNYELKEYSGEYKVGVITGFETRQEAREWHEEEFGDEIPLHEGNTNKNQ